MKFSMQSIASLGGGSRQAVQQYGDPVRWLKLQVREFFFPAGFDGRWDARITRVDLKVAQLCGRAAKLVGPTGSKPGRRVAADPGELGRMLGVAAKAGESVASVWTRWVVQIARELAQLIARQRVKKVGAVRAILDALWLPRSRSAGSKSPQWLALEEKLRETERAEREWDERMGLRVRPVSSVEIDLEVIARRRLCEEWGNPFDPHWRDR